MDHLPQTQHNTINPLPEAAKATISTCRPKRDHASKQTELPRNQHFVEHFQVALFNMNRDIEICPACKKLPHPLTSVMGEGLAFVSDLNHTHHYFFVSAFRTCMHAASGLFSRRAELLAFASRTVWNEHRGQVVSVHVKSWMTHLSSLHVCSLWSASCTLCSMLPRERA